MNGTTGGFRDAVRQQKPWGILLAVNVVIMLVLFANKVFNDYSENQYSLLLATYHFGFAKRALIGSLLALVESKVHYRDLLAIGGVACLVTAAFYIILFKRVFGFGGDRLQLFVFTFGSPFVFKNFLFTLGYFDIYGCLLAIAVLLLPVNALFPLLVTAGCVVALLIHHLHILLYIPTIAFIWMLRVFFRGRFSASDAIAAAASAVVISSLAVTLMFFGTPPVPAATMTQYMLDRAADPLVTLPINAWYSTLADELRNTAAMWPAHLQRMPLAVLLIAVHWPVAAFMRRQITGIGVRAHRLVTLASLAAITVGYIVIGVIAYDYARWLSNWAVCMFLCMHAIAMLQPRKHAPPFAPPRRRNAIGVFGLIVTALPRVGVIKVF